PPGGRGRRRRPGRPAPRRRTPAGRGVDSGRRGRGRPARPCAWEPSPTRGYRRITCALGDHGDVRAELVDEIEEFVRRGKLWHADDLNDLIARLESEADDSNDPIPRQLSGPLRAVLVRMRIGEEHEGLASDVEGMVSR